MFRFVVIYVKMDKWFENKDRKYKVEYTESDLKDYEPELLNLPLKYYLEKYWYWGLIITLMILLLLR